MSSGSSLRMPSSWISMKSNYLDRIQRRHQLDKEAALKTKDSIFYLWIIHFYLCPRLKADKLIGWQNIISSSKGSPRTIGEYTIILALSVADEQFPQKAVVLIPIFCQNIRETTTQVTNALVVPVAINFCLCDFYTKNIGIKWIITKNKTAFRNVKFSLTDQVIWGNGTDISFVLK